MKTLRISCAAALAAGVGAAALAQNTGPSSSASPYVLPTVPQASTTSILTVGDTVNGYRMVGIPDGLGGFIDPASGLLQISMNHELGQNSGIVRAHGSTGSFVSRWQIDPSTLEVVSGRDHNTSPSDVYTWNGSSYVQGTTQWGRFCSADLAAPTAYAFGDYGTTARIHLNGEEIGNEGRAFAHVLTGANANTSWQLPKLGRYSWENAIACPYPQMKTVVMGDDDSTPGQVYMYVGTKTDTGNDVERAGLTNGTKYGIHVQGWSNDEPRNTVIAPNTPFSMVSLGDVSGLSGNDFESLSNSAGVSRFLRPEDGAWDPRPGHQNDYYFVTTDRYDQPGQAGRSRLYRVRFSDMNNPEAGGTITAVLDGTEGQQMMDNICIDTHGRILIQEDIGNNAALGKLWVYDIANDNLVQIAQHDPARFAPGGTNFLTQDEESSGIIDAKDLLGDGWFVFDVQAHYGIPGELVEGGQLLAMYVDPSFAPEPGSLALLALGGLALVRRRG